MFSEHFPMENSVTFLLDPNPTQTGKSGGFIRAGKETAMKFSERKGAEML